MSHAACSRCNTASANLTTYFLRWAHDVFGYFAMCDNCVENYQEYIVEDDESDEEDE